jgi:hypothetical protein
MYNITVVENSNKTRFQIEEWAKENYVTYRNIKGEMYWYWIICDGGTFREGAILTFYYEEDIIAFKLKFGNFIMSVTQRDDNDD